MKWWQMLPKVPISYTQDPLGTHIYTDMKNSRNTPRVWEAAEWGWVSESSQVSAKKQAAFFKFQKESLRVGGLENRPG